MFRKFNPAGGDIRRPHISQIIEAAGNHVALLNCGQLPHRAVESLQRAGCRYRAAAAIDEGSLTSDHSTDY